MIRSLTLSLFLTLTLAGGLVPLSAQSTNTPALKSNPKVLFKTSLGDIVVELDAVRAPLSTANFLSYVDAKAYDGTVFHRIIPGFCVQGGGYKLDKNHNIDFENEISAGHTPIKDEATNGVHNLRGTLAMARTNDPNSATSQFFFNLIDDPQLDPNGASPDGYAVFGKVISGLDVVDKMAQVPTTTVMSPNGGPMQNVPASPVVLISATRMP